LTAGEYAGEASECLEIVVEAASQAVAAARTREAGAARTPGDAALN